MCRDRFVDAVVSSTSNRVETGKVSIRARPCHALYYTSHNLALLSSLAYSPRTQEHNWFYRRLPYSCWSAAEVILKFLRYICTRIFETEGFNRWEDYLSKHFIYRPTIADMWRILPCIINGIMHFVTFQLIQYKQFFDLRRRNSLLVKLWGCETETPVGKRRSFKMLRRTYDILKRRLKTLSEAVCSK